MLSVIVFIFCSDFNESIFNKLYIIFIKFNYYILVMKIVSYVFLIELIVNKFYIICILFKLIKIL